MTFHFVEAEVAGGLGAHTLMDRSSHPPVVTKLHYEFDGWLGDNLLESFPAFIVTDQLKKTIVENKLTGIEFAPVEITTSQLFKDLYPDRNMPKFAWLKVNGIPGVDDFGMATDGRLVVSDSAFRQLALKHAVISEYH